MVKVWIGLGTNKKLNKCFVRVTTQNDLVLRLGEFHCHEYNNKHLVKFRELSWSYFKRTTLSMKQEILGAKQEHFVFSLLTL